MSERIRRQEYFRSQEQAISRRHFLHRARAVVGGAVTASLLGGVLYEQANSTKQAKPEVANLQVVPADILQYYPTVEGKPFTRVSFTAPGNAVDAYNFDPNFLLSKPGLEGLYSYGEKFAASRAYLSTPTDENSFDFVVEPLRQAYTPTLLMIAPESAPAPKGSNISKQNPGSTVYTDGRIVSLLQTFSGQDTLSQTLATQVFAGSIGVNSDTQDHQRAGFTLITQSLGVAYAAAESGKKYQAYVDLAMANNMIILSPIVFNQLQAIPVVLTRKK